MRPDAKDIKARVDIVEYLVSLGVELKPVGAGVWALTDIANEERGAGGKTGV